MFRTIFILIMMLTVTAARAYTDHRGANVDSAEQVINSGRTMPDRERLRCYYIIVRGTLGVDSIKHDKYSRLLLALAIKADAQIMQVSALRHLGLQFYGKERYDSAEYYFKRAIAATDNMRGNSKYDESDLDDNYSQLYGTMGNLYNMQDKGLIAIEYYQKALTIFEKRNWLESQTILHHNVAELWLSMGNNEKAKAEYLRAIETGTRSGDSLMMALPRKGLVKVYVNEGDFDNAYQTVMPAYLYYKVHKEDAHDDYPEVLASMAKMYLIEGHEDIAKAKEYAQTAFSLITGETMYTNRADVLSALAMIAIREGRWKDALEYCNEFIHKDDKDLTYSDIGDYELLVQIYLHLGDNEAAFRCVTKMRYLLEQFSTRNYQSSLSQMEVIYETEKKEAQIATMANERKLYRWLLFGSVALLFALIGLFFLMIIVHRRQKALLATRVALEAETNERNILARDLHDSLGGMLSLLRLKITHNDADTLQLLDNTVIELRRVSHHLMPEQLLRSGIVTALTDFAVSVPFAHFQSIGKINASKELELVLYRCAYELVNNAMKHAQADHIDIQLMQESKQITLTVSDNGQGMKQADAQGMGLQNIRERIEPYRGTLNIISNETDGTEIIITLPL